MRIAAALVAAVLSAGCYTVGGYAQVCNGNCGSLSEPTDHCSVLLELGEADSRTATIEARPGGCRISVD